MLGATGPQIEGKGCALGSCEARGRRRVRSRGWDQGGASRLRCAGTHSAPILTLPSDCAAAKHCRLLQTGSQLLFHPPFSKGLIKAGVQRAQEGNDRPQSPRRLPFTSVFPCKTRGAGREEGGERSSRKNKNSSACARGSGGGRSSAARAPSAWLRPRKRGAAAPPSGRAERRTRLVGRGGDPGPGAGGQAPALPTTARLREGAVTRRGARRSSVSCTPAAPPSPGRGAPRADSSPGAPSSARPQAEDTPPGAHLGNTSPPIATPWSVSSTGQLEN